MNFDLIFKMFGDKEFKDTLKESNNLANNLHEKFKTFGSSFKEANEKGAKKFNEELFKSLSAVELLKKGFEEVGEVLEKAFDFSKDAFKEYRDLIQQDKKIELFLRNVDHNPDLDATSIKEFSEGISKNLAVKLNEVEGVANKFLNVDKIIQNGDSDLVGKLTQLSYDAAAGTGRNAGEIANVLGNLYQDPQKASRALKEFGGNDPRIKDFINAIGKAAKKTNNYAELNSIAGKAVDYLTIKYQGFAEELAKADPLYSFTKAMNNLEEKLGPKVAEVIDKLLPYLDDWIDKLSNWLDSITDSDIEDFGNKLNIVITGIEDFGKALLKITKWILHATGYDEEGVWEKEYRKKKHPGSPDWIWTEEEEEEGKRAWKKHLIEEAAKDAAAKKEKKWKTDQFHMFKVEEENTDGDLTTDKKNPGWTSWLEKTFDSKKFGVNEQQYGKDLSKLSINKLIELLQDSTKLQKFQEKEIKKFNRKDNHNTLAGQLGLDTNKGLGVDVKGPKNTNVYVTINGNLAEFNVDKITTTEDLTDPTNRNDFANKVGAALNEVLNGAINQVGE